MDETIKRAIGFYLAGYLAGTDVGGGKSRTSELNLLQVTDTDNNCTRNIINLRAMP